jgi:hypothetical protein
VRYRIPIALALLAALGLSACSFDDEKPLFMAPGSYGDVAIVVSHESMIPAMNQVMEAMNEEFTFVLARETLFNFDVYGPDRWDLCKGYKNILFVWRVGDGGPVEKALKARLTEAGEARVQDGRGTLLQMEEPFANYQFSVILAGTDRNSLLSFLRQQVPDLKERFERKSTERIMRRYRYEGLDTETMSLMWRRHRFFLELPRQFQLNQDAPDGYPGVEFMQTGPSRGITVAWSQSSDPELLLQQHFLLLELRKEMGLKLHHEDVEPTSLVWKEDTIGDLPAVRLEGAWTSRRFDGGGPFWCWFVADPAGQRVFCLDALCYAPGLDKLDFFRRMRSILQTFSLERPQP